MPKKPAPKATKKAKPVQAKLKVPVRRKTAVVETAVARAGIKVSAVPPQATAAPKPAAPTAPAATIPALPPAPEGFVNVFVDGVLRHAKKGSTIMQACTDAGKEIPHFCYHDRLSIAGNCRMCLVEIEGMPKPVASCHWPVGEGNKIRTDSKLTIEARKGTMEMLLINHPLDCPICDQGGECDLQDQAVAYGADRSHYHEFKRAVDDKDIGAKIKTVMTRCIHCTRCIRFATEVAGVEEFGATGRGENMQVGTYVEAALQSELAGNMIDLCPVGALTSKPYAYTARPWEVVNTEAIDILDGVGSNIYVQHRAGQVMRLLPREADAINEEWMTDAARFSYDALHTNRLATPLHNGKAIGWPEAFKLLVPELNGARVAGLIGNLQGAEDAYAMREFFTNVLGSKAYAGTPANWNLTDAALLRGYTPFKQFEQADAVLLIGANPKLESPLLNARLRKLAKKRIPITLIGAPADLTYKVQNANLESLFDTKTNPLANAQRPLVILGAAVQQHLQAQHIAEAAFAAAQRPNWNGYNFLTPTGGTLAPLALGFGNADSILSKLDKTDVLFIHGDRDDVTPAQLKKFKGTSIYLGTHSTPLAQACTLQLPTAAWAEKSFTSLNMQGTAQTSNQAVTPPHNAKEDWKIYRALSEQLGKTLPFDTLTQLRSAMKLELPTHKAAKVARPAKLAPLAAVQFPYYLQNAYLRQSPTMHACQAEQGTAKISPSPRAPVTGMGPQKPKSQPAANQKGMM
ncbi:MAG TPA: NADH-quinone oxidoreductase subunit NuoG [Alphaproteobacteria bacterium]|nr:NADH-quinone oxidoreductase subunit NuoG [Alphaproteobacteria bacterium]